MSCTIVVCQALDHQLVPGNTAARTVRAVEFANVRFQFTTYAPSPSLNRFQQREEWMSAQVAAELDRSGPNHLVLVADHNNTDRFGCDPRLIRAIWSLNDTTLCHLVNRVLGEDRAAISGLLAWFWKMSPELPPRGLSMLLGSLGKIGSVDLKWSMVRERPDFRRALSWLPVLDPDFQEDAGFELGRSLLASEERVSSDDDRRFQHWLETIKLSNEDMLERFCRHAVARQGS